MSKTLETRSGRVLVIPDSKENAEINAGIAADPDTYEPTEIELKQLRRIGRPPIATPKVPTTIRFDADVLAALKATGKGWQTRVNEAMRDWIKNHPGQICPGWCLKTLASMI